ncbi:MAG: MotE family protein [Alphaproteobacteria bacterium]
MRFLGFIIIVAILMVGVRVVNLLDHDALAQSADFFASKFRQFAQNAEDAQSAADDMLERGFQSQNMGESAVPIINNDGSADENNENSENAALSANLQAAEASPQSNRRLMTNEQALVDELGKRRAALDQREAVIARQESLLAAAEAQLIERQRALESLDQKIQNMIADFETNKEDARSSVIETYNIMNPRAAAGIFDELELPVLIGVVRTLNPRKLAQIMAQMDPIKARDLTAELANKEIELE